MINLRKDTLPKISLDDKVEIICPGLTFGKRGIIASVSYNEDKPYIVAFDHPWIGYYKRNELEKI
jgi:hypothetical protein